VLAFPGQNELVQEVCARKRRGEGGKEREKKKQENAGERRGEREEIKGKFK
jgi:hypothetical protein